VNLESELTFTYDDVAYRVDVSSLTVDEWIELEEQGIEFSADVKGAPKMKMLKGIAWAAVHRERPEVTFEDLGRVSMLKLLEDNTPAAPVEADENPSSPVSENELAGD
jgi:hypothetical protein